MGVSTELALQVARLAGAFLVMMLIVGAFAASWAERQRALEVAEGVMAARASALSAHASQVIASSEAVLSGISEQLAQATSRQDLVDRFGSLEGHRFLRQRAETVLPASLVSVFDEQGTLIGISRQFPAPRISIADREAYRTARAGERAMFITAPVSNRIDGRLSFFVARRLQTADGRLLGVAHVGIDCETLANVYGETAGRQALGRVGAIAALFREIDGQVLAQSPGPGASASMSTRRVNELVPPEPNIVVRVRLQAVPLSIAVLATEEAALADWRNQAQLTGAFIGLTVLLLLVSFAGLTSALERRDRSLAESLRLRSAAEASSRVKSRFLSLISHELRTPLEGVLGGAEQLAQTPLSVGQAQWVKVVLESGTRLLKLLDAVLELTRLSADDVATTLAPAPVHHILSEFVRSEKAALTARGCDLSIRIAEDVPQWVRTDAVRLRQILVHMHEAMLAAEPVGPVRLEVARTVTDGREQIRCMLSARVTSNKGLSKLDPFVPFAAWEEGQGHAGGGTGVSLTLASTLVRLLGGQIGVQRLDTNEEEVWFQVPAPALPEPDRVARAAAGHGESAPPPDLVSGDVLVVEDDEVNATVLGAQLQRLGCHVQLAADGDEAMTALKSRRFDLVLMDCMLPGASGHEVTARWRALEAADRQHRTPIVALSADTSDSNVLACRLAGMDEFASKPASLETLRNLLARWLPAQPTRRTDPVS